MRLPEEEGGERRGLAKSCMIPTSPWRNMQARILFAGTPGFALEALRSLHGAGYEVAGVITQPDRAFGRGRSVKAPAVTRWARQAGLNLIQPSHWQDDGLIRSLRACGADLMVAAAYGAILPASALEACRLGAINIHASLLPRWRGASPVAAAIRAGDQRTGVTLMRMETGLDTGPLLARSETGIGPQETAGELEGRLARMGAALLLENLPAILAGQLGAAPQQAELATYAPRMTKAQGRIDWSATAEELARHVRAYDPWPVAHALWQGRAIRFWGACALEGGGAEPGRVAGVGRDGMQVGTGEGALQLREVQLPGRRRMPAADAARGAPLAGSLRR